jgi:hypothetical protein
MPKYFKKVSENQKKDDLRGFMLHPI